MSDLANRIAALSPKQRELLERRLKEQGEKVSQKETIQRRSAESLVPLSLTQQRLWFLDQFEPNSHAYNIPITVRMTGHLNIPSFQESLNEIVRRHEILRTTFATVAGQPVQVIAPSLELELPVIEWAALPEDEREAGARRLIEEEARRPFDLSRGPLLRVHLLRLSETEHIVLLVMHHIISDGWSMGVLVREVGALYSAYVAGQESPLEELEIQYADFSLWQREWLKDEVLDEQLSYWRRQLAGVTRLELPTDYVRPAVQSYRGAELGFSLSEELTQRVKAVGQLEGATLFMVLLAAFDVLLWRYTGSEDVAVGTPIAGRTRGEVEGLIGFFVNTLVLRGEVRGEASFRELVREVRARSLEAYAHQDVPFEMLVTELAPERSLSHTPLFQVAFGLQNAGQEVLELPGLRLEAMGVESGVAKFDLMLTMAESEERLSGTLEYNTDLFKGETMARLAQHFETLLGNLVAHPEQSIASAAVLTPVEAEQLMREWNPAPRFYAVEQCLHERFEEQAAGTPEATALVFEEQRLSYGELNQRANQLAHHLQTLGVGVETLVGICVERSLEMVIGLLGILKAGAAYVPLDPAYPAERLSFMLEDAGVSVLLTQAALLNSLPAHQAEVVRLDEDWPLISEQSTANVRSEVSGENLAYVIYTSGSTGTPKGVLITHAHVARLLESTDHSFHFSAADVWTLFHSYAFDFSVWELWGALCYGARLVVVPYWVSRAPEKFYDLIVREQVTVLNQTPSAFRQLSRVEERLLEERGSGVATRQLALRVVIFGGEALELASLRSWFERHGDEVPELINMYGITETTVHVTYRRVRVEDVEAGLGSVIGRGLEDLQLYVLDAGMEVVPVGVAGELYVGGAGLARGYLKRAELTAERFVPDPYGRVAGGRLYRTGDVVRYVSRGELEYVGRADEQVKVRGFRIELGEIEAVLSGHAEVAECVVMAREDGGGAGAEKRLVAYVVAKEAERVPTVGEMRTHLQRRLPDYMVPQGFVMMESLPLTPNGKINRKALPAPEQTRPELSRQYVAPRTPVELTLAALWAEVLGMEHVGVHDNFFELGGDSIRSIQIRAKGQQLGLDFSIQQLFQHQTIGELAEAMSTSEAVSSSIPKTAPFSLISDEDRRRLPEDVEDAYPLAMLQMGMLYHSEYDPESALYHNVSSALLKAPFDFESLDAALQELAARHPVLRTSFDLSSYNEPIQLVHRKVHVPLEVEDLRHLSETEQEEVVAAALEIEKSWRFDWARAPLLRFRVHLRSEETFQVTWTEHHAILDGWSVASMLTELFQLYLWRTGKNAASLDPPPAATFRDFIALEREALSSDEARRYWVEKLSDANVTTLPRLLPAGRESTSQRDTVSALLSREIVDGLKRAAQSAGAPLKSVLLAAHLRVLSLVGGQSDVVTGLVANGRPEEVGGERILGLFLNTLPFRLSLVGGTWVDLVRQTFEAEREMLAYRRFPVAELQKMGGNESLFEAAFNFVHFHVYENLKSFEDVEILGGTAFGHTNFTFLVNYTLDLSSSELKQELSYDPSQFDEEQMKATNEYYVRAITAIAQRPLEHYQLQSLLSVAERQQQLVEWNDTASDFPRDNCVHQLFEQQAARTPGATALLFENQQLSYRELNQRADQLAHHLQSLGVGTETLVGICVERSPEMVIGLLGILKAGGAYVPLDPQYPQERLSFMLADSGVKVLLTQESLVELLPGPEAEVVRLDADWPLISKQSAANVSSQVMAENLAYLIYTSGSTGVPKGVAVTHRGIIRLVCNTNYASFSSDEVFLQLAPASFDASTFEIWGALLNGARLAIMPDGQASLAEIGEALRRYQVTTLWLTAGLFHLMVDEQLEALLGLRQLLAGGDVLGVLQVHKFLAAAGGHTRLVNGYGPTENTTFTCCHVMAGEQERWASIPIGKPVSNTQLYVLDEEMQMVALGASGELYVGGDGLARGYWQRPEQTAERFVPHPFSTEGGTCLYRTGDVVRYLGDGNLEFIGRADEQVKIRGFRIELGEIESVLSAHQSVREVIVIAREDTPGDKRLVAYLVSDEAQEALDDGVLRAYLKERLPDYMIPSAYVFLDALPLTPNGKVDRKALPEPEHRRLDSEGEYVAARTPVEELLVSIWQQVLGLARIGIHDNFFDLGGHSLLATQLISRLRHTFTLELPLRLLFEHPTIAALASAIESASAAGTHRLLAPPLIAVPHDGPLPLSFAQQRLWFLDQLEPGSPFYNIPAAVRLRGPLEIKALTEALQEVVRRQASLRTTFASLDGQPVQVIDEAATLEFPVIEFSALPEDEREAGARRLIEEEARRPFDLSRGPLLRLQLLRLTESEHIVLLVMHHIISDGWSMGVLVREVGALYSAYVAGQESPLEELEIQYADFSVWQREWLKDAVLEEQLSYWKRQLAGVAHLELPTDYVRPPVQSYRGAELDFSLTEELTQRVKAVGQLEGATLFMVLLAAFDVLLWGYTGSSDVAVGTPIAGRTRREVEALIGFFVNTLVMRVEVRGELSFRELVSEVRTRSLEAYAHQDVPFEMLVTELAPERSLSHTPLFQVMFILQNAQAGEEERLGGIQMQGVEVGSEMAKFDLTLAVEESAGQLHGVWEYNTDLFKRETVERMSGYWQRLLEEIVAAPQRQISELRMLSAEERQLQLEEWNATARSYPSAYCLHQLFEEQAARTPTATALIFEDQRLTYDELNQRANQLARHLQALGVGVETLVGICVERSLAMVVGLLGILKAGGAYVPLDPQYPQERVSFMLEDSGVTVLLTQARLVETLPAHHAQVVRLDADWEAIGRHAADNPASAVRAENLAYVIYTSGSTGIPKGVLGHHRGLVNRLYWMWETYPFEAEEICCQKTSLSFVDSLWEIFGTLGGGAKVVIIPDDVVKDVHQLVRVLDTENVTRIVLVPSLLRLILEAEDDLQEKLPKLKYWASSGEALPIALVEDFRRKMPGGILLNLYGSSEVAADSTWCDLNKHQGSESIAIGRPIANTSVYIVDQNLEPSPVGAIGELYIGGAGLGRGYLNRPELTGERFVPNPFGPEAGTRLYRTGDLGRYRSNGEIEYVGRRDQQVKIRGLRIELGEIETALSEHEEVREAVATVRKNEAGDERLVAYVVREHESAPSASELRTFLTAKLPDYMVPQAFVMLDTMPLTPNGKTDRRALPAPDRESLAMKGAFVAPRDVLELELAHIWETVLGLDHVGVNSNFFELGGHSLMAVRLFASIEKRLGVRLPLAMLFRAPTIEQLASLMRETAAPVAHSSLVEIQRGDAAPPIFFVHPVGGHVLCYFPLAQHLGSAQPFYGLQARGLDGEHAPDTQIETMAAHYIEELRHVEPEGPYRLGGWSMGGVIAFEMARQLVKQGQEVSWLALLDSRLQKADRDPAEDEDEAMLLAIFAQDMGLSMDNLDISLSHFYSLDADKQLAYVLQQAKAANLVPADLDLLHVQHLYSIFKINLRALRSYAPEIYPGRIILFNADEQLFGTLDEPTMGWGQLAAGGVDVHTVPGNHFTIVREPHVNVLAEQLMNSLRNSLHKTDSM
jgi:amino acid adenylation domain-containing protein